MIKAPPKPLKRKRSSFKQSGLETRHSRLVNRVRTLEEQVHNLINVFELLEDIKSKSEEKE